MFLSNTAFRKLTVNYVKYKQQLLEKLEAIQKEIMTLEAEGRKLDRQLEAQCQQIQQAIDSGRIRIESLKAENQAKKKALNPENEQILDRSQKNLEANLKSHKQAKVQSKKEQAWDLAYCYSCINNNTPVLHKDSLDSWVKKVTKDCAEIIRSLNHHIIEGNLNEIEKITGFITVEKVFTYVSKLVEDIRELAEFFNVISEIRAVYSAFTIIIEELKDSGFFQKSRSQSYNNYSRRGRDKYNSTARPISQKDFPLFKNYTSIKEAKELRKKLSIENHPDRGGSEEEMKKINHQFDLFIQWIEQHRVN